MTSDKSVSTEQRLNNLMAGDAWHSISLNTWSGSLKYRFGMDLRHVHVKFTGSDPRGTVGDNLKFKIATLPAAYRPNNDVEMALTTDKIGSSGNVPHVFIDHTNGDMNVYGVDITATQVSLNGVFPIFDD